VTPIRPTWKSPMRGLPQWRSTRSLLTLLCLLGARDSFAQMLDVDALLVEASAVPGQGTVRLSGGGGGQTVSTDPAQGEASIAGSVLWVPFKGFGGDVGAYYQAGRSGPSARVRYQFLSQGSAGIDLTLGARYKSEGFSGPGSGEVEALLALGRSFGQLDLILNLVWGWEVNGPGQDAEIKALVGWRFTDNVRLGLEVRAQTEVHDEDGWKGPQMIATDLRAGPTLFWRVSRPLSFQVLVGVGKPVNVNGAGLLALGSFALDL